MGIHVAEAPVIAVDVMGGDRGPRTILDGAIMAQELGHRVLLVGDEPLIRKELKDPDAFTIVHGPASIPMGALGGSKAERGRWLRQKDTSIRVGMDLIRDGRASAFVSAGDTGAMGALARIQLKKLPGVTPGIATLLPRPGLEGQTVLMDSGATLECEPWELAFFATMGSTYARAVNKLSYPKVALLSNGEEESKGLASIVAANRLLSEAKTDLFEFVGNVEGRDPMTDKADVVVTSGFNGNVCLKTIEGTAKVIFNNLLTSPQIVDLDYKTRTAALNAIIDFGLTLHPDSVGGSPLLGVDRGYPIISHGSVASTGIMNAIKQADTMSRSGLINELKFAIFSFSASLEEVADQ